MRTLVALLFVVSCCSPTEQQLVPKCQLKDELKEKLGLTEHILAKIVCHVELASGFNTSAVKQLDEEAWKLYGLFQLSDHLVCSDGTTPSANICGMECSYLTDADREDDIDCLQDIFKYLMKYVFWGPHSKELIRMIKLIFQDECRHANAAEYFTECH